MAVPKEERTVEIIVNGQKANASLKEMNAAAAVLYNQFQKLSADDPGRAKLLADLQEMKGRVNAVKAEVAGVTETTGIMKQAFANAFAIFTGGGLIGVVQQLFGFFSESRQQFLDANRSGADLDATLKSTAHSAGLTAEEIKKIGTERAKVTLFDDDETNRASAMLLTFTNIKKGVFEEAIPAIQNLATKMGGDGPADLKGASIQVGKALNDPVNGLKALTRVGVTFDEQQKAQIKTMVKAGDTAGAQRLILAELSKEFGGAAEAARAAGGGVATLKLGFQEFEETVGGKVSQVLNTLSDWLGRVLAKSQPLVDMVSALVDEFADYYHEIGDILVSLGLFNDKTDTAAGFVAVLKYALTLLLIPLKVGLQVSKAMVDTFIDWYNKSELLRGILGGLGAVIVSLFTTIKDDALKILGGVGDILIGIFTLDKDKIAKGFKSALASTADLALEAGNKAADAFAKGYEANKNNQIWQSRRLIDQDKPKEKGTAAKNDEAAGESDKDKKAREKKAKDAAAAALKAQLERIEAEKRAQLMLLDVEEKGVTDRGNVRELELAKILLDAKRKVVGLVAAEKEDEAKLTGTAKEKATKRAALQNELAAQTSLLMSQAHQAQQQKQAGFDKQDREDYKKFIEQKLADIEAGEVEEEAALEEAFEEGRLKEKSRNKAIQGVQMAAANSKVALVEATEGRESAAYRKAYKEREKLQKDHHAADLAEDKKLRDAKRQAMQTGLAQASDVLQSTLSLLDQDGDARKKHHTLYMALATAKVLMDGIAEVQAIWQNANSNWLNTLVPGWGPAWAAVQTGMAVARTTSAISHLGAGSGQSSGSYYAGGVTGDGSGMAVSPMGQLLAASGMSVGANGSLQDGSGFAVAGVVHEDEYVVPKWMRADPQVAAVEQWLEARRLRGFADGGPTGTGSSGAALPVAAASPSTDGEKTYAVQTQMLAALLGMTQQLEGVKAWQQNLQVHLNLRDTQSGLDEYKQVRQNSAIRSSK